MVTGSALLGFVGVLIHQPMLFAVGYIFGQISGIIIAIYLPSLFIYKLYKINQKVTRSHTEDSKSNTHKYSERTD